MKKYIIFVLFFVFYSELSAQNEITSVEIYNHIDYLASDSLQGRFPGTKGGKLAAEYIRQNFKDAGLELLNDDGFQFFDIYLKNERKSSSLKIDNFSCQYVEEYQPLMFSPSGNYEGGAVFAGYGFDIEDSNFVWNDYKDIDVSGKWVVVFRGKPDVSSYPATFFDSFISEYSKVIEAQDQGAIGVIFINGKLNYPDDNLMKPCNLKVNQHSKIPAFSVKRFTADRLLKSKSKTAVEIEQEIRRNNAPIVFDLNINVSASLEIEKVKITTQNVVGLLPGNNPVLKGQYIIVGAHYDHLGFGGCGSASMMPDTFAVHNGADDNASGVAGVLELAEYFSADKNEIGRSIIFVDFGAEERGLLGSSYFVHNLPVEKDSIFAMINFDMIGKYAGKLNILGTGTASEFDTILKSINYDKNSLNVKLSQNAFSSSDHASFIADSIPALFFYASSAKNYHTPFDDVQFIDTANETLVLKYAAKVLLQMSNYPVNSTFVNLKSQSSGHHSYNHRVKFGIVPSFEDTGDRGLKISGVVDDGAAQKAGMKTGDIIMLINNQPVTNIYDYMARLQKLHLGELVDVTVLRNSESIELKIQL